MSELADFLIDQLAPLGPVSRRRMFGCAGLFQDGRMFALISGDGRLYVKADADNVARFAEHDCPPFTYVTRGRQVALSYYEPPETVFDDQDELLDWARQGLEAAARAPETRSSRNVGG
ncbi:TfoX/Sxy family protein [Halomonas huangheensis]|uniref:TfoX N-terminal domain-containing protein n=1 Tax=Halomonas huangheensis TaxID=1178482 RepID=W1N8I6_9GAMM|nr:TfoX/Sxy family protein [Halomonas huangheensis]ALM53505.1 hypothetical protein AR456_15420 [Halomonas huangheensis]ERL51813.1 hypothetical protein BJB45_11655 [Halomonas huangheensis]